MRRVIIAIALILLVLTATSVHARGELGKRLTLYSWFTAFKGTMILPDSSYDFDASFGDIADYMNFPIAFNGEYWRGRWGGYLDINYIGLEEESITDDQTQVTVVKTVDLMYIDFGAGYQLGPYQLGSDPQGALLGIDILLGGRYVWLQDVVDYRAVDKFKGSSNWVDPVLGARLRLYPARTWVLTLKSDVATGSSDLMWNFIASANWEFADHWWLNLAYRGLGIDYKPSGSGDEVGLDATIHGPVLGLSIAW